MESLTGSLTNVALLTFHKTSLFPVKGVLYSILFSSVHSLHHPGDWILSVKGWEKVLPPEQQGQDTAGAVPSHCWVIECLIDKRWKKLCAKAKQWLFHEILLLLTHLMVHTHKDATKNLSSDFLPVFQYLFVLLFLMSDFSFLCIADEEFYSWGVAADGTLPLQTEDCGI